MPKLSDARPVWWQKKWVSHEDGTIYRGKITQISFGYNPLTETISAGMVYTTEFFSEQDNDWNPIFLSLDTRWMALSHGINVNIGSIPLIQYLCLILLAGVTTGDKWCN